MPANEASAKAQGNPELPTFGRERLSPGAYHVDLSAVETFVLRNNGQPSTFGDIYYKLRNAKILQVPERFGMYEQTYLTNSGEVTISGESGQSYVSGQSFVLNVLRDFIDLAKDGVDPERATWFYYGHDWSMRMSCFCFSSCMTGRSSAIDFRSCTVTRGCSPSTRLMMNRSGALSLTSTRHGRRIGTGSFTQTPSQVSF